MAIKIGRLFNSNIFTKLSNNAKLIYIYLASNPNILSVGVLSLNVDVAALQLCMDVKTFRAGCLELVNKEYISVDKFDDDLYFTVIDHFDTIPKSDRAVTKVTKELQQLPKGLVTKLDTLNIKTSRKVATFVEPTEQEVMDYSLSQGYKIDARVFIDYYRGKGIEFGKEGLWLNFKGKQVKDWKATARRVWFKEENKLKTVKGAPKGFESFYINFEGKQVFPESWKNGLPHSKNIAVNKALKREYEEVKRLQGGG